MSGASKYPPQDSVATGLIAALLACFAMPASAQQPTQAQQNAIRQSCRSDYQAVCSTVPPGGKAALSCLQQHADQVSAPCRDAVAAVGGASGGAAPSEPQMSGTNAPAQGTAPMPPPAAAPPMSPRQQLALLRGYCGADFRQYCRGVPFGGGRALGCLQDHSESLSPGCRRALSHAAR